MNAVKFVLTALLFLSTVTGYDFTSISLKSVDHFNGILDYDVGLPNGKVAMIYIEPCSLMLGEQVFDELVKVVKYINPNITLSKKWIMRCNTAFDCAGYVARVRCRTQNNSDTCTCKILPGVDTFSTTTEFVGRHLSNETNDEL